MDGGAHGRDGPSRFDVPLDWTFPELGRRVLPDGGRVEVTDEHIAHTEYDTAAGDLAAFGVLLTRPPGTGASWTLHLDGRGDDAITVAAPGRGVPVELRELLLGVRAGAALRTARRVQAQRTVHAVLAADGAELGEIADIREHVAETGAAATVHERRRVEVSGWDGPFLAAAGKRLRKAGAEPAGTTDDRPAPDGTVGAAVHGHLRAQHDAILRGDLDLRRGGVEVHRTRVAIRRLRSVLRIVDVTDPDRTAALDAELAWLSGLLGTVRDHEVLRGHLRAAVAAVHAPLDATAELIDTALDEEIAAARAGLATAMAGRRYLALQRALREWHRQPPFTAAAAEREAALAHYVRRAGRQLDKRLAAAAGTDAGLHRARKAAKRARYVATFAEPMAGKPAVALGRRAKAVQKGLGKHQDCVLAIEFLQRVGADADGAAAFGCGVLWARERRLARRTASLTG